VISDEIAGLLAHSLGVALPHRNAVTKLETLGERGDTPVSERLLSQKFACVHCGISYSELTPRMFSFNSPYGACAACSGLGTSMYFDPDLIVPNEKLSLAQGAIAPWEKKSGGHFYQGALASLARHFHFDLDTPFKKLPEKVGKIILQGSEEEIAFVYEK